MKKRISFPNTSSDINYALVMYKYLSHWSAAKHWELPYVEEVFRDEFAAINKPQFTVFNRKHLYPIRGRELHCCEVSVPPSVKCVLDNKLIVSVEFMFVQLAKHLDIQKLILLGMLICGNDNNNRVRKRAGSGTKPRFIAVGCRQSRYKVQKRAGAGTKSGFVAEDYG